MSAENIFEPGFINEVFWLFSRGLAAAEPTVPESPGMEYAAPGIRLHYSAEGERLHYRAEND